MQGPKEALDGSEAAHCKLCHFIIAPRISNLSMHEHPKNLQDENCIQKYGLLNITKIDIPRQNNDTLKKCGSAAFKVN